MTSHKLPPYGEAKCNYMKDNISLLNQLMLIIQVEFLIFKYQMTYKVAY